jgi:hypothetical protein
MKAILDSLEFVELKNIIAGVAVGMPLVGVLAIFF